MNFTSEEKRKIRETNNNFEEEFQKIKNEWGKFGEYTEKEIEELSYATFVLNSVGITPEQYGIIYKKNFNWFAIQ